MDVILRLIGLTALLILFSNASSQSLEEEDDLALAFGDEDFISIATGSRQPIARAPAVASVITAEEIKAMGARNLDEVLESVPGLHVSMSSLRFSPIYSIRGIYTDKNPHVLVLMNGVPITQVFQGDRGAQSTLPVHSIQRVEIIRGPGSAIYGADAFAGVINVITKERNDIDGTEFGVRAGSFDTYDAWALTGGNWNGYEITLNLEWNSTNGDDNRIIESDAQTIFDNLILIPSSLEPVSLAPGQANTRGKRIDTHIDIKKGDWRFHLWNWRQIDLGVGPGLAMALDPTGRGDVNNYLAYLSNETNYTDNWLLKFDISYMNVETTSSQTLFPAGTILPIGTDGNINPFSTNLALFPDGFIGNPEIYEQHSRIDISAFYTGIDNHRIRIGSGIAFIKLHAKETKNFGPGVIDGTVSPLLPIDGTLTDVTDTPYIYIGDEDRNVKYLSLQDEWSMAPDWDVIAGVRYDDYSDFGDTINPRIALIWQTRYNLTSKFLFGQAFRPPSFQELFNKNNPVAIGNPNLDPETINTYELAIDYQPTFDVHNALNIFYYKIDDLIEFVSSSGGAATAQNIGKQTGKGFEFETTWKANEDVNIIGNYSYQNSINETTNKKAGNAPQDEAYVRIDWNLFNNWYLSPQLTWVANRDRVADDTRQAIDNYTLFDITLRNKRIDKNWEMAISAHNLFDEDAREPSPFSPTGTAIPNDFLLPGRSVYLEFLYHL